MHQVCNNNLKKYYRNNFFFATHNTMKISSFLTGFLQVTNKNLFNLKMTKITLLQINQTKKGNTLSNVSLIT